MILQVTTNLPLPPPEPARDKLYLFHDRTFPVSLQEFFQIEDILLDLLAGIGIGHQFSAGEILHYHGIRENIRFLDDRRFRRFKRFMGYQTHSSGITYQRISRNSRLFLLCFGKATVDDQQLTAAFDG